MTKLPEPVARGDLCGRRAGERFRTAFEQNQPLSSVFAVCPKNLKRARAQAYEMIDSPDETVRDSGRFWLAYYDALQNVFPEIERFA